MHSTATIWNGDPCRKIIIYGLISSPDSFAQLAALKRFWIGALVIAPFVAFPQGGIGCVQTRNASPPSVHGARRWAIRTLGRWHNVPAQVCAIPGAVCTPGNAQRSTLTSPLLLPTATTRGPSEWGPSCAGQGVRRGSENSTCLCPFSAALSATAKGATGTARRRVSHHSEF